MSKELDDNGNGGLYLEEAVDSIAKTLISDEEPEVVTKEQRSSEVTAEPEVVEEVDELDSIVDSLVDDDDSSEAGDDQENEEETETSEEPEEVDNTLYTIKIDGEDHEVTLDELKKGYGLQQSLTRKGQELAEERKKLEAEAEAVAWAKATPEIRRLNNQIMEANQAIERGFTFDENGEQVRLTHAQIEQTKKNVEEAQSKLVEMATPPRLEELREAIPEIFNPETAQEALKPYGNTLSEFGYSQAEIQAHNDPRTFFILKELHEKRDLASRVDKAKARRQEKKAAIASKTTKAAGPGKVAADKSTYEPKLTTQEIYDKIAVGEASPADLFME